MIDPDGKAIGEIYTYDTRGYLTSSTDATGSTRGFRHNILGQLVEQSLPAIAGGSPTIALHYDSDGKVVAVDRPRGSYQDVSLPGSHITDRYERDVLGHVVRTEIGANTSVPRITERKVDYRGYPERKTAPDGGRSRFSYDERGLLLRTIVDADDGSKLTERRVYDEAGRLKTVLNGVAEDLAQQQPGDIATRYEYDDLFGRVTHVHMQSGRTIRYTWGERDLLLKEEVLRSPGDAPDSPLIGTSRSFEYDERGRMIRAVEKVFRDDPATATELVTEVYHDADSRIVKIVDPRGGIRRAEYDTAGRKVLEVDPMLNERSFIYRTADRAIDITRRNRQPDGTFTSRTATTVYDERGRLSRLIEPGGAETRTIYDDRDLPVESIIPDGTRRLMSYGLLGEMIEQIDDADDLAIANRWQYDMVGRPLAYLDPTSEMSRYRYDGIGRLVRTDLPGGASVERLYGSDGRIRRQTLASGARIDFTYDAAGRVASLQGSGATGVAPEALDAFTYDELDRLVSATVGGSTVQRAYDNKGRLVSETSHGVTLTGFYDDLAGTAERRWDDGRRELLSTDLNGTVTGIERTAQGTLGGGGASMATFTADGGDLGSADLMGGIHVTAEYDERKRLISILYQKGATTIERAASYMSEDADVTLRLYYALKPRMAAEHVMTVYETLERPMPRVLARMEQRGISVDRQILSRLSGDLAQGAARFEDEIYGIVGERINIGSPKQLGDILFGRMGLPGGSKTKSGQWSTSAQLLEDLAAEGHELPRKIVDWRQLTKLKSTYTDALPGFINPGTNRVHTSYALAATTTGRLSSSDPNLQNIPVRTAEGRKIRTAFIADKGHKLVVLVGDEPYYARSGFKPIKKGQVKMPGPVNPARLLVNELVPGAFDGVTGLIRPDWIVPA